MYHKEKRQKKTLRTNLIIAALYCLAIPVTLHGSVESSKVSLSGLHNKKHLNFKTESLKDFSRGVFHRLCVTHNKSSNKGNLEPKSEVIFFFIR